MISFFHLILICDGLILSIRFMKLIFITKYIQKSVLITEIKKEILNEMNNIYTLLSPDRILFYLIVCFFQYLLS